MDHLIGRMSRKLAGGQDSGIPPLSGRDFFTHRTGRRERGFRAAAASEIVKFRAERFLVLGTHEVRSQIGSTAVELDFDLILRSES